LPNRQPAISESVLSDSNGLRRHFRVIIASPTTSF
jgi:hypothetical protein